MNQKNKSKIITTHMVYIKHKHIYIYIMSIDTDI